MNESNDLKGGYIMDSLSANEAKTHFGDMLLKAQRSPIRIKKNGKPVAVIMSTEEYESMENLKLQFLQARAAKAREDIAAGNLIDGEEFFKKLEEDD